MLGQKILILLIGFGVVSSHVIKYKSSEEHVQPTGETAELMPFITHFLPQTKNFFYKPQFYISSPIAKIIEKDCERIEVSHEFRPEVPALVFSPPAPELPEPIIVETEHIAPEYNHIDHIPEAPKPIEIPPAPELPPFTIPHLPLPVQVIPDCQDSGHNNIPESPISVEINLEHKPIAIPQAPELPPFIMPELPLPEIVDNNLLELNVHEVPIFPPLPKPELPEVEITHEYKPIEIPHAPELPPFTMPELPSPVIVDANLEIKPCVPELPEVEITHEYKPIEIPHAPELPPLIMPELPSPVVDVDVGANLEIKPWLPILPPLPELPDVEISLGHKPIEIPHAPELPPLIMPELPSPVVDVDVGANLEIKPWLPILPPLPELPDVEISLGHKPIEIPHAPELPPLIMPELPSPVVDVDVAANLEIKPWVPILPPLPELPDVEISLGHKPVEIPHAPELPPFIMPELPSPVVDVDVGANLEIKPWVPILPPLPKPELPEVEINLGYKPIEIPHAPELPSFTIPELPTPVVVETIPEYQEFKPWTVPEAPKVPDCEEKNKEQTEETELPIVPLPEAPVLPDFIIEPLPEYQPEHHIIETHPTWSEVVPEAPSVPHAPLIGGVSSQFAVSFPNYCAHTIVLERVLPNMGVTGELDINRSNYPVFQYPAPTPYYTPVY